MIDLCEVAEPARSAMGRLRDELPAILGNRLLAIWLYGGQLQDGGSPGDVDGHVLLTDEPTQQQLTQIRSLHRSIRDDLSIDELDVWYIVRREAVSAAAPRDVNWHEEARDENWALKRAHWFAGAYVLVFGVPPTEVVPRPHWTEIEAELLAQVDRAGAEIERTTSLPVLSLRLCRVARTLATRDVVQSKLEASEALSPRLSPTARDHIAAAARSYQGVARAGDEEYMRGHAASFYREIRALIDADRR